VIAHIVRSSDGYPLFVEELLATLVDRAVLRRVGGRWTTSELPALTVPPTVQALIAARLDRLPDDVVRVTLVHLTDSAVGATSSPLARRRRSGLSAFGRALVEALDERAVLVDLAHVSRTGFWDAFDVHSDGRPLVVSHTGLYGVQPSWRNLTDDQVRGIALTGGVIGVMYHRGFLGRPPWKVGAEAVVRHLEHAIAVGGEEVAALGSDWDGMIVPPRDMPTVAELPVLVDHMLRRGWRPERVARVLGGNWLRVVEAIRPQA
jgi:membrane dipeptidase